MDLKATLAANKAKAKKASSDRTIPKVSDIDDQDRPYSIFENTVTKILEPCPLDAQEKETPLIASTHKQMENHLADSSYPIINTSKETENKPETNWEQSGDKVGTNQKQSGNKAETKKDEPVDKLRIKNQKWEQSGYTTGNKVVTQLGTNRKQSGNKAETKTSFSELVGLQRNIIIFIYHECKNTLSSVTESLTLEYIASSLKCSADTAKTTIRRLEKKGSLIRVGFKNGRGGWSRYELPKELYHEVLRSETGNKVETNWEQTGNKVGTQPGTEPETSVSSSSSLNINKTTTTNELPEEWNFDITPYARFGFSFTQLKQLASLGGVISAADVEQSLIDFSYDLDNNALPPIKTSKINFLMGLLRGGHAYTSEAYRNEQEAMILEMARRAEAKRQSLLEAKFMAWEASLSDDGRKQVLSKLPPHLMSAEKAHGTSNSEVKKWYFDYFMQNVKE